jgi:hypothetical protein
MCRTVVAMYGLVFALVAWTGCSGQKAIPVMEASAGDAAAVDAAAMLAAAAETEASATDAADMDAPAEEPQPDPMIDVMERYDALEATVDQLLSDVDTLGAGQTVFQAELRSLEGRVEGVETSVEGMADRILTRFDNFDSEIARIREGIANAPPRPAAPRVSPPTAQAEPKGPTRDFEAEVALQVDAWRQAWEARDVAAYVATYQEYASINRYGLSEGASGRKRSLDVAGLRTRMERLVRQYARMEVLVRGFRVVNEEGRMVATFQQDFSAWARADDLKPAYTDKGIKTLAFVEQDGGWLVIKEDWVPVQ